MELTDMNKYTISLEYEKNKKFILFIYNFFSSFQFAKN